MSHSHYELLGVALDADVVAIKKRYRQLALKLHPDKCPDDPEAASRFDTLNRAYEELVDPERRAVYDRGIRAELERRRRTEAMDRKRKSMAESLQERERAATNAVRGEKSAALDKAETLQRLREEGLRRQQQLERELHEQREATQRAVHAVHVRRAQEDRVSKFESAYSDLDRTVKVRWDRKRYEHDARSLREKLVTFGDIVHVQVSKGKPTAVVQFASIVGARAAVQQAKSDDLDVQWASGQLPEGIDAAIEAIKKEHVEEGFIRRASVPPLETPRQSELSPAFSATSRQTGAEQATRPGNAANPPTSLDDYEAATMRRMQEMIEQRQREKRRKEALAKVQKDADSGDDANAS